MRQSLLGNTFNTLKKQALISTALSAVVLGATFISAPAAALVTPPSAPPASVIDTTRPYWVGLAIRNEAGNGGSTCTGLLINPRTVLFAAHCVDGLTPAAYNGNSPGNRAQVGYTTEGTFGTTNLRNWLFGQDFSVAPGDGRKMTDSVMVWYDQRSRNGPDPDYADGAFLPADVAIAGFNTPTEILGRDGVNGIGLLFSQVNGLVPVTIGGFGQSGNGLTGSRTPSSQEDNFSRRLGKNMLGFLGDERTVALGVYGTTIANLTNPAGPRYQDLYWIDFDNPNAATQPFSANISRNSAVNTFDFDVFHGGAVAGESITAAGDSGSPLVTNAFGREVSLGVLSQGSRYFFDAIGNPNDNFTFGQTFSNYGSTAGYNPLFLFWDQILVNNPYKYVGAKAGDAEWSDATHWEQELDPLYFTLSGTSLVNALPTTPAIGSNDTAPNVGTIRANPAAPAACAFTGTCAPTGGASGEVEANNFTSQTNAYGISVYGDGEAPAPANEGPFELASLNGNANLAYSGQDGQANAIGEANTPLATTPALANGTLGWFDGRITPNSGPLTGVGSTNFVPNNVLGTAGVQNSTRWFEVNLRAAGTTHMTATSATIDRLNIRGANSVLNIKSGSMLRTMMSSYVDAGRLNVDGNFIATQLNVLGGVVSGNGIINTTTGVLVAGGVLTAGTQGGVGTMGITGGAGFGTAGVFGVDVASATSADRLNVTGNLVLGGGLAANFLGSYLPDYGTSWTIASVSNTGPVAGSAQPAATSTISGQFSAVMSNLTGVLRPRATISGSNLILDIYALPFASFAACTTAECNAFATALDNRANYTGLRDLYRHLDYLSAGQARDFLHNMTPWDNQIAGSSALLQGDVLSRMVFGRLQTAAIGGAASASHYSPRGIQIATADNGIMNDGGANMGSFDTRKNGLSLFGEIRSVKADAEASGGFSGSKSDGFAYMVGIDKAADNYIIGVALQGASSDGQSNNRLASADATSYMATVYGGARSEKLNYEGYLSMGQGEYDLTRVVGPFTMVGNTSGKVVGVGVAINGEMKKSWATIVPRISFVYDGITLDAYRETGTAALSYGKREIETSVFRVGATILGNTSAAQKVQPWLSVFNASNLGPDREGFGTIGFANAQTTFVPLTTTPLMDENWFEVGVGIDADLGKAKLGIAYETTAGRDDVTVQSIRARLRVGF